MPWSRREALHLGGSALAAGLAGCSALGTETTDSGTTPTDGKNTESPTPPTPRPFPERPDSLSKDSVQQYVVEYEHTVVFNRAVERGAHRITLDCDAILDLVAEEGFYAYSACAGSYSGGGEHADLGYAPVPYFVSENRTVRLGDDVITKLQRPSIPHVYGNDNGKSDISPAQISVYNFDTVVRSLRVRVHKTAIEDSPVIYDETEAFEAEQGLIHDRITMEPGQYRLEVSLDDGTTAERDWEVTSETVTPWDIVVYITPPGTLRMRSPAVNELGD